MASVITLEADGICTNKKREGSGEDPSLNGLRPTGDGRTERRLADPQWPDIGLRVGGLSRLAVGCRLAAAKVGGEIGPHDAQTDRDDCQNRHDEGLRDRRSIDR